MLALMISPSGFSTLANECVGIGEPAAAQDALRLRSKARRRRGEL